MSKPPVLNVEPIYAILKMAKVAAESGNNASAARFCDEAWQLIPEPQFGWDSSYICTCHTVTILRRTMHYDKAISLVQQYLGSGFYQDFEYGPHFWLGTLYFEKGELTSAYSHLERANKMSKGRCFKEEDQKYRDFFRAFKTNGHAS